MDCEILQIDALPSTPPVIVGGNRFGTDDNESHDPYHHFHHSRIYCLHHYHHYQHLLMSPVQ